MRIKRRKKIGLSLLVAGTGISVGAGCAQEKIISGNTVAPPTADLCFDVKPETATVTVDQKPILNSQCTSVRRDSKVIVEATAGRYEDYKQEVLVSGNTTHVIQMKMVPEMPTGNLMAPPMINFCVEVEPELAAVKVDQMTVAAGKCTAVFRGSKVIVNSSAEGYQNYKKEVFVEKDTTHTIKMTPTKKK